MAIRYLNRNLIGSIRDRSLGDRQAGQRRPNTQICAGVPSVRVDRSRLAMALPRLVLAPLEPARRIFVGSSAKERTMADFRVRALTLAIVLTVLPMGLASAAGGGA